MMVVADVMPKVLLIADFELDHHRIPTNKDSKMYSKDSCKILRERIIKKKNKKKQLTMSVRSLL